jgi:TM2 domain-containing membrane protein YozV
MEKTYCEKCGTDKVKSRRKNPVIAALLSCIIPELGQVYAGDPIREFAIVAALGVSLCLMALLIGFLTFLGAWVFAVIDTYKMVEKRNSKIGVP